jgi:hypothetical protein
VGAIASLMSVASMAHCEAPVERKGLAVDRQAVRELRQRLSDLLATSEEARWLDDGDYTCSLKNAELGLANQGSFVGVTN